LALEQADVLAKLADFFAVLGNCLRLLRDLLRLPRNLLLLRRELLLLGHELLLVPCGLIAKLTLLQKHQRPQLLDRIGKICGRCSSHEDHTTECILRYKTNS
jgi:hypothetical protein